MFYHALTGNGEVNISGTPQMAFQQNVEFDIGKGNYCIK